MWLFYVNPIFFSTMLANTVKLEWYAFSFVTIIITIFLLLLFISFQSFFHLIQENVRQIQMLHWNNLLRSCLQTKTREGHEWDINILTSLCFSIVNRIYVPSKHVLSWRFEKRQLFVGAMRLGSKRQVCYLLTVVI